MFTCLAHLLCTLLRPISRPCLISHRELTLQSDKTFDGRILHGLMRKRRPSDYSCCVQGFYRTFFVYLATESKVLTALDRPRVPVLDRIPAIVHSSLLSGQGRSTEPNPSLCPAITFDITLSPDQVGA